MCTPIFITALFIIARTWKQPRCPSLDKWLRKLWCIYTMEYYSTIKNNTFESVLMKWKKLESIIQGFPGGSKDKASACNTGDLGSIPGLEDPLEEGMATHTSILAWRVPLDRGAWRAAVHGVAKRWTQLSDWTELNWTDTGSSLPFSKFHIYVLVYCIGVFLSGLLHSV